MWELNFLVGVTGCRSHPVASSSSGLPRLHLLAESGTEIQGRLSGPVWSPPRMKEASLNQAEKIRDVSHVSFSFTKVGLPGGSAVKNVPASQVRSLGWEDPLKEETTSHSQMLAWRVPGTEEPGKLRSMGLQRAGHDRPSKHRLNPGNSCGSAAVHQRGTRPRHTRGTPRDLRTPHGPGRLLQPLPQSPRLSSPAGPPGAGDEGCCAALPPHGTLRACVCVPGASCRV